MYGWFVDVSRPPVRVRDPRPLIKSRLPSGRGATEQPNVTHEGEARLTQAFWLVVGAAGVAAGLFGAILMNILYTAEHLAFGFDAGTFESGAEHASALRRVLSLAVAGIFGGGAWFLIRRHIRGRSDVDDAIWTGDGTLSFPRSLSTSVTSMITVGMGVSLGREAAPKLMGAASASLLATWARLSPAQKRLAVACGAGAGLAAVYSVPLGGALFTAEVLIGGMGLPVILPALACSWIATATTWIFLPAVPTYAGVPDYPFQPSELVWAVVAGPPIGLLAVAFTRVIGSVSHHRPSGWRALVAPLGAFLILGGIGVWFPQLLGNGKGIALDAFLGRSGLGLLVALALLKPVVTTLCLGSGASGGLFTPVMSTGAAVGGALGIAWSLLWPGTPAGAAAMIGAAAMTGAATQAPLSAVALVLELTHSGFELMVPMMAATMLATAVARHVDGYSIYSARLAADRTSTRSTAATTLEPRRGHMAAEPDRAKTDDDADIEEFEPDYRFTLANERTFLAWLRTSLGLLAAAVAVVQLVPELVVPGARHVIGGLLAALAIITASTGLHRWGKVDEAMRRGLPLPRHRAPVWLGAGLIVVAVVAFTLVMAKALA